MLELVQYSIRAFRRSRYCEGAWTLAFAAVTATIALSVAGCGSAVGETTPASGLQGRAVLTGSSTVAPLASEIAKRFMREAKELLAENDLPRPLQYYSELFKTAFEFIDSNRKVNIPLLHTEYVTFSERLLEYFCKVYKDSTFAN